MEPNDAWGTAEPVEFRSLLEAIPTAERDAWLDRALGLGLDAAPLDGPALPRGCVPYLPCAVDAVLRAVDLAEIGPGDVFVDVGAGVGRAAAIVHLVTRARVVGVEIQPAFAEAARELAARARLDRFRVVEGDATDLEALAPEGSIFFFYCPFGAARFDVVLRAIERLARVAPRRLVTVDLPVPALPWLERRSPDGSDVVVHVTR